MNTALRIIELARNTYSICTSDITFVKLSAKIFFMLGDVIQLRWIFNTILSLKNIKNEFILTTKERYQLSEEFLVYEMQLGVSDNLRLDELRLARDRARLAYEESEKRSSGGGSSSDTTEINGLYDTTVEILARYSYLVPNLPQVDSGLQDRVRNFGYHIDDGKLLDDKIFSKIRSGRKDEISGAGGGVTDTVSGPQIPIFLKDLISRLPQHTGGIIDVDAVIEQLRRAVLPPRPAPEDHQNSVAGGISGEQMNVTGKKGAGATDMDIDNKRNRDEMEISDSNYDIGYMEKSYEEDFDRNDIFRQRQRMRLLSR